MDLDEINGLLESWHQFTKEISPEELAIFEGLVGEENPRRYTYYAESQLLRVKMPESMIHSTAKGWAFDIVMDIYMKKLIKRKQNLRINCGGVLRTFYGRFAGSVKVPDAMIYARGRLWPTIVFEVGYTESYSDLKADARLLLEGSRGKIGKVFLIKLKPLKEGETEIAKGFVEIWEYRDGVATKQCRKRLFPEPRTHAKQIFQLELKDLLRCRVRRLQGPGCNPDDIVGISVGDLRECIREGTKLYLAKKEDFLQNV